MLAHVYTVPEVQDAADFVGDSLGLSRQAAALDPSIRIIVFCGVHFMAETAAMLSPDRTVLLPDPPRGLPDGRHGDATRTCAPCAASTPARRSPATSTPRPR